MDISTILPVFIGPIFVENDIVGVVEFILKKKKLED